jgi:hypothetical protein
VRIPSWLEAEPLLHPEAAYIEADRFFPSKICLQSGDGPYIWQRFATDRAIWHVAINKSFWPAQYFTIAVQERFLARK